MTKQQAIKKSEERFPTSTYYGFPIPENTAKREIYMKCWEDMTKIPELKYMKVPVGNKNSDHSL